MSIYFSFFILIKITSYRFRKYLCVINVWQTDFDTLISEKPAVYF